MKITKVHTIYFSPTGNAEKVAKHLGEALSTALQALHCTYDCTPPAAREAVHTFGAEDLVVCVTPTYAGRVPNKLLPYWQTYFVGNGALAVPVAVFGNRSFDNCLSELRDVLETSGFHTVAGAGIVTSHVFSDTIAPQRPNQQDWNEMTDFAQKVAQKLLSMANPPSSPVAVTGESPATVYYTPLGTDGKPAVFLKAKPQTYVDKCDGCGACIPACPMGSISDADPKAVTGVCIKCQACVKICPTSAKYFDDPAFLSHIAMLEQHYARPAQTAFFL